MSRAQYRVLARARRELERGAARTRGIQLGVDVSPVTTRCSCGWSYVGSLEQGRERFSEHRARAH